MKRHCRALWLLVALAAVSVAHAGRALDWPELRPPVTTAVADPFAALSDAQFDAMRGIVRTRVLVARGHAVSDALRADHDRRVRELGAQGLDVDALLAQRDSIMRARRALAEAVVESLDGAEVRIAGYLLPSVVSDGRATEFLLVSTPGACSHVSPPPPNQVIRVRVTQPLAPGAAYAPALVSGMLRTRMTTTALHIVDGELAVVAGDAIEAAVIVR